MTLTFHSRRIPNRNDCIYSQKDLRENVHGSFIYNSPKLEIAQLCINR